MNIKMIYKTVLLLSILLCMICLCSCGSSQKVALVEDDLTSQVVENSTVQHEDIQPAGAETENNAAESGDASIFEKAQQAYKNGMIISAGFKHLVGVKSDGTVIATGWNDDGQCDTSEWDNITMVSAGHDNTIGLKKDGTVTTAGSNGRGDGIKKGNVSDWSDIVAISAGKMHTVGLKSDGTVVAVGNSSDVYSGQCNVDEWTDIIQISAGTDHSVGLKSDGTVVAVGDNGYGQCNVSEWTNIIAISAGEEYTLGLKNDGTIISTEYMQYDFSKWTNVIAISAGDIHAAALKADGTLLLTSLYDTGVHNAIAISAGGAGTTLILTEDYSVINMVNMGLAGFDTSEWQLN